MARALPYDYRRGFNDGDTRENAVPCQNCRQRRTFHKTAVCWTCRHNPAVPPPPATPVAPTSKWRHEQKLRGRWCYEHGAAVPAGEPDKAGRCTVSWSRGSECRFEYARGAARTLNGRPGCEGDNTCMSPVTITIDGHAFCDDHCPVRGHALIRHLESTLKEARW